MMKAQPCKLLGVVLTLVLFLGACGRGAVEPSQVLATVNADEVTVHQLNLALTKSRQNNPSEKEREALLGRLIDRQLIFQQAQQLKLDRRQEVMIKLEDMRMEIMVAAYVDELASKLPPPEDAAVAAYYQEHPSLFAQRRLYRLREITIPAEQKNDAPKPDEILDRLKRKEALVDVIGWLGRQPGRFYDQSLVRPAEDFPVDVADQLLAMKTGDVLPVRRDSGLLVYEIQGFEAAPLTWKSASPVIKTYLAKQKLTAAVNDEIKRLRSSAKLSRHLEGKT